MDTNRKVNVLFLCTGNSARSILGEALLNELGGGRFQAFSAGSRHAGRVHPLALELLQAKGLPTAGLRSKNWQEFEGPGAPALDIVFTVCDSAAKETCPIWPGHPVNVHWGIPDPAAAEGGDAAKRIAFLAAYNTLRPRIAELVALPMQDLDPRTLAQRLRAIAAQ
jgi:protein-tyrosine-phosphatase